MISKNGRARATPSIGMVGTTIETLVVSSNTMVIASEGGIYRSDPSDYSGGHLELLECNQYPNSDDIRQQGSIIFFPSFVYHKANPVTSGIRYSLAIWFEGPYWRWT